MLDIQNGSDRIFKRFDAAGTVAEKVTNIYPRGGFGPGMEPFNKKSITSAKNQKQQAVGQEVGAKAGERS
jgi:hypothetical protein